MTPRPDSQLSADRDPVSRHAMAASTRPQPVVVGVDGSSEARAALSWAAGWAAGQDLSLRAVAAHVVPHDQVSLLPRMAALAEASLCDGLEFVRRAYPALEVDHAVMWDSPGAALVAASRGASFLVLGGPALGSPSRAVTGTVSGSVAEHARCPVIVVPERGRIGWRRPTRVVFAADGSPEAAEAGEFAFAQAQHWAVPLRVVRAWDVSWLFGSRPGSTPARGPSDSELRVEAEIHPLVQRYPEVPSEIEVVKGRPATVLRDAVDTEALLVLGSRGLGGFAGLRLGSVSRSLLHTAPCPVAVVRTGQPDAVPGITA